ncbi:MAG: hypothetical protein JRF61_08755 [Deltaproteobacteria bacterium]|jgi:hypothetical protein|nr:hypothetical protein [Deltaproteobacteria bacterium]
MAGTDLLAAAAPEPLDRPVAGEEDTGPHEEAERGEAGRSGELNGLEDQLVGDG